MISTHLDSTYKEGNDTTHFINQLTWFREGMAETIERKDDVYEPDKKERPKLISAVQFNLPYAQIDHRSKQPEHGRPSSIIVLGNGLTFGEVYFMQQRYQSPSRLWRLFSYSDSNKAPEYGWGKKPKGCVNLKRYFTTEISPFLKDMEHPLYGKRNYMVVMTCVGSDYMSVVSDSKKDRSKQTCTIKHVPDPRDAKKKTLLELQHINWEYYSPKLEEMVSTTNFKM
jgi:hypothetical protein